MCTRAIRGRGRACTQTRFGTDIRDKRPAQSALRRSNFSGSIVERPPLSEKNPVLGEKTRLYPYGYGFCQCGCRQSTQPFPSGIYPRYLPSHRDAVDVASPAGNPMPAPEPTSAKAYVGTDKALLEAYLELNSSHQNILMQINVLGHEVELISKMVRDFWQGTSDGKRLVLEKLSAVLKGLNPQGKK